MKEELVNGKTILVHDNDCRAIPIVAVREVLDLLPYGSVERVMFEMLFYTGCRPSELDRMQPDMIHESYLYWTPGKGQSGFRKEILPENYLKELRFYRETHRVPTKKLFGVAHHTFRRYFNRDIRPRLGPLWHQKRLVVRSKALEPEYVLQLKGLRKTWATMLFAKEWSRWEDSSVALEFTSKRMHHSSKGMTVSHYLQGFDSLQIDKMSILDPHRAVESANQRRLADYGLARKMVPELVVARY